MPDAEASSDRARLIAWRVGIGIYSFAAVTGICLAALMAVRSFWPGVAIFAAVALFEAWRGVTVYRRKPDGMKVDLAMEQAQRNARLRLSAWLITVCAVGCGVLAALGGRVELWLIAGLLAAGAALAWITVRWLIPRATRS